MGIGKDIKSFVSGKDLVVFSIALALSTQFQTTIKTLIDQLIMPFVSYITGKTNLNARSIDLVKGNIKIGWGAAAQSVIVLVISLVLMVEIAKYVSTYYVKSSTVTF
jgi:large-conductance mechanosensitive channel